METSGLTKRFGGRTAVDRVDLLVPLERHSATWDPTAAAIADLAREHGISVHELTPRHASLEEAYMELTHDSVEYRADVPDYAGKGA